MESGHEAKQLPTSEKTGHRGLALAGLGRVITSKTATAMVMSPLETYLERAAECRREAEQTILPNVREQCLRSAFAWEDMADRVRLAEKYRAEEAQRKRHLLEPSMSGFLD